MHEIRIEDSLIRTDLNIEQTKIKNQEIIEENSNIKVLQSKENNNSYTTICFNDITDHNNFQKVQDSFIKYLKKYISIKENDKILVIGLGNENSTPDALGPMTIDHILVTRYLFLLGDVEEGYSNVCTFTPNVMGNTGIETADIIKSIIEKTQVNKVIVIDSLKTASLERLTKTIQITNKGISPGSGIFNNRKEISKETMNIDVVAIGIPTVVDIKNIIDTSNINSMIVTPTNIDFIIEKLSLLLANGINNCLHKNFIRQNYN